MAVGVVGVVAVLAPLGGPGAGAAPPEEHCVLQVVGQKPSGEFVTAPIVCRSSKDAAMQASTSDAGASVLATQAIHYDNPNLTGSSLTVTSSSCANGWINLTLSWRNKISSTDNFCTRTRHFDNLNLFGIFEDTTGDWANLSASLNNKAESIEYRSS